MGRSSLHRPRGYAVCSAKMPKRRRKTSLWRRSLMAAATVGQKRRRHRRGRSMAFLLVLMVLLWKAFVWVMKIAWAIVHFLIFGPTKAPDGKGGKRKTKSLRSIPEWQSHFRDARAIFVRTAEQALGPENLQCACCPTKFPTHGKRGFHVDHIYPVNGFPDLSFNIENFQLLCETCNIHKSDSVPLVRDRRPYKLRAASARARRAWLRKHGGVDPIHALIVLHKESQRKKGRLNLSLRRDEYA